MAILLISIILIMKKWNNNNNNLDNETSAVALIILLSRECKVPRTIHRWPRYFQHLWHHHSCICPCLQIFSTLHFTTNHYNHRALNGCTKHQCSWCQYSSIESQLTLLTLTSHWTCPHSSPTWIVIGTSALGGVLETSGLEIDFLEDLLSHILMKCGTSGFVN